MYKLLLIRYKGQLWQINELPVSHACTAGGGEQLSPLEMGHQMGSPKPGATYCHVPVCVWVEKVTSEGQSFWTCGSLQFLLCSMKLLQTSLPGMLAGERSAGGQVRFGDSFILQEALCIFKIWVLWYNLILYLIFTKLALSLLFSINDCAFRGELILFKTRFCILQFDCEYGILKHFCSLIVQLKTLKNKY